MRYKLYLLSLFHDEGPSIIETSPLIYRANQWTGFFNKYHSTDFWNSKSIISCNTVVVFSLGKFLMVENPLYDINLIEKWYCITLQCSVIDRLTNCMAFNRLSSQGSIKRPVRISTHSCTKKLL